MKEPIRIAIDGPSGAGKSTLARLLSRHFGLMYADTGAIYRAIALQVLRSGINMDDKTAICELLSTARLGISHAHGVQHVFLSDEDVTGLIRTEEVSAAASKISAITEVRAFLLDTQKQIAAAGNVIMDGRDIGTQIMPNADVKLFLTASLEDRARRRYEETIARGEAADLNAIINDMSARDNNDSTRSVSPLRAADDAILVDTTGNTLEQSVTLLKTIIERAINK